MRIYTIYIATNKVNLKCYVGFDSNWPRRLSEHKSDALTNRDQYIFHRAIRKYGWKNFDWQILYQSTNQQHTQEMEGYFIQEYKSHKSFGNYNMTFGGEGCIGYTWTRAQRKAQSKRLMGVPRPRTSRTFIVTTPTNQQHKVSYLPDYCKEHNLDVSAMYQVSTGRKKHYKGFSVVPEK